MVADRKGLSHGNRDDTAAPTADQLPVR
jgi:hypothetical protein